MTSRLLALLLVASGVVAGACSHSDAPTAHTASQACPVTAALQAHLATAARLVTTVIVGDNEPAGADPCALQPGTTAELRPGHRARLIANSAPEFLGPNPGVVTLSTAAGPTELFGGIATRHVIVTLRAERPGRVRLTWEDCSGTEC